MILCVYENMSSFLTAETKWNKKCDRKNTLKINKIKNLIYYYQNALHTYTDDDNRQPDRE